MAIKEYSFKVSSRAFREVQYFTTFFRHRFQGAFVAAIFALAVVLFILNTAVGVAMSNVMQMCYIVCLISIPLLMFSCKQRTRKYKESGLDNQMRHVALSEDWIKLRLIGSPESEKLGWKQVSSAYELHDRFLLYRGSDNVIFLPKNVMGREGELEMREVLIKKLGRGFHSRLGTFR